MDRRTFLGAASAAVLAQGLHSTTSFAAPAPIPLKPMALGLIVSPFGAPETVFHRVHELGFSNCFLSLDAYIYGFKPELATQFQALLAKYELTATTVEVVGPGPLEWNFLRGPSTIGLVPPTTRAARIDALRQASDFAKLLEVPQVQTHCMSRMLRDVRMPNLAVGLDTANLILYGKANPVDAVDILGPFIRSVHAKDGRWPVNPSNLGEEVLIGKGLVDFKTVFTKLHRIGYTGAITIERETSGPQQIEDVRQEKLYLDRILREVLA